MWNYLEEYSFTVLTDHQSLRWLQRLKASLDRLVIGYLNFNTILRSKDPWRGTLNEVTDALFRLLETAAAQTQQCH